MSSFFSALQAIGESIQTSQENKALVKENNTEIQKTLSDVLNLELSEQNMDQSLSQYFTLLNTFVNDATNSVNPSLDYKMYAVKSDGTFMTKGVSDTTWTLFPNISSVKSMTANSDGSYYFVTSYGYVFSTKKIESYTFVNVFSKTGLTKAMKMPNGAILAVINGALNYKTSATDLTWLPIANPGSGTLSDFCLSNDQKTLLACFTTGEIYKMEDYTLLETGWKKVSDPVSDPVIRSISVAPDGTTYAVKADGKIYYIEHVNAIQGQGPGWTIIQVPLSGVTFVTIGYNGAMQLTNESDLKKIKDINDSLQEQIQTTIRERMNELYADQTGLYPNKEATIKRLNATFEQLQRDREQIDMLLKDYYSYDESQESAALYAESSNMRFRVLFVVFFVIVIFMIRSMMRKGNPFIGLANPLSERMLYLGIVVALLFALNLFQNTFGFILFAGLLLLAVLLVSGPGSGMNSVASSYMTPGSIIQSPMVGSPMVGSPMVGSPMVGSPMVGSPMVGSPVGSPFSR